MTFYSAFVDIHRSGVLTALARLVPHKTAAFSAQVLCTPYNHAPCHFTQSHVRKVHACSAVTCHLYFWQNDRDLLRATAVRRGWNGHRNTHRVSAFRSFQPELPVTARPSRSRQKQKVDLGKPSIYVKFGTAPLTDHHGWSGEFVPCSVVYIS